MSQNIFYRNLFVLDHLPQRRERCDTFHIWINNMYIIWQIDKLLEQYRATLGRIINKNIIHLNKIICHLIYGQLCPKFSNIPVIHRCYSAVLQQCTVCNTIQCIRGKLTQKVVFLYYFMAKLQTHFNPQRYPCLCNEYPFGCPKDP